MIKYEQEFIDKVEELRLAAGEDYSFMLSVVKGDEESLKKESERKMAYAKEIQKENMKAVYEGSLGDMLSATGGSKITEEELEVVIDAITEHFEDKPFKSKDLVPKLPKDAAGQPFLNSRKLPSRLKKLLEFGKIQEHGSTKPKSYQLVKDGE